MANSNLKINYSDVDELRQDYPAEIKLIIKMLTEVSEGCHLEIAQLQTLVAS